MEIMEKAYDIVTTAKDTITDYFNEDTLTSRKKLLTLSTICLLIGIIAGFIFSPIKKGIYINVSNNGNNDTDNKEETCCNHKRKGRR